METGLLRDQRILIAEDEPIIALDLASAIEEALGEVAGPVASIEEGLAILAAKEVHAAILDVQLANEEITPLAFTLLGGRKVVVFHTATVVPAAILERHGEVNVCRKPAHSGEVVRRLAEAIARAR
ncbi:MAG: hypothetical protein ACRED9_00710 [Caulobacteraceae bacterium]